jgi:hypothetical protein
MRNRFTATFAAAILFASCGDGKTKQEEQIETSTYSITTTAITAAIVGAPMSGEAEELYRDRDRASDEEARTRSESSVTGEMVVDATCVAFEWTDLVATVTFTDCESLRTGDTIDGTASLSVSLRPSTIFVFTFTDLEVGGTSFDGSVTLEYTGAGEGPTSTITADLTFNTEDGSANVTLNEVVVDVVGDVYTLNGDGHVFTSIVDADFTTTDLTLVSGDCLPTSGSITFTIDEVLTVVTFDDETPATGVIGVQIGEDETENMDVFPPCP